MITIVKLIIFINRIAIIGTKNPVKISLFIITLRALIFYIIKILISRSWFSIIFFLIFIGGILIVFLILSSLRPNEKSIKLKLNLIFLSIVPLIILISSISRIEIKTTIIKWTIQSRYNIEIIILIILIYFFSFIIIIASKKITLRSI